MPLAVLYLEKGDIDIDLNVQKYESAGYYWHKMLVFRPKQPNDEV